MNLNWGFTSTVLVDLYYSTSQKIGNYRFFRKWIFGPPPNGPFGAMLSLNPATSWLALSLGLEKFRFEYSSEPFPRS